jgi:hypothetical protein
VPSPRWSSSAISKILKKKNAFLIVILFLALIAFFSKKPSTLNKVDHVDIKVVRSSIPTQKVDRIIFEKNSPKNDISEKMTILCEFKKLGSSLPHSGKIKVRAMKSSPPYSGNILWIKSSECPKDKFSILFFSDEGHISKEINCLDTTFTELRRFSGEQADVDRVAKETHYINIAISGPGYFVLQCPDEKLLITREGRFKKVSGFHLSDENNCLLLNENGRTMTASEITDGDKGCSTEGDCVAIYDPGHDDISELEYKNSYSFTATKGILPSQSITKIGPKAYRPYLLLNSLELVHDNQRGEIGINWKGIPVIDLDEINCPD